MDAIIRFLRITCRRLGLFRSFQTFGLGSQKPVSAMPALASSIVQPIKAALNGSHTEKKAFKPTRKGDLTSVSSTFRSMV